MESEDTLITSRDGAEITALVYEKQEDSSDIVFIGLPAMGVKAAYYKPLALALFAQGHSVMLCDLRGQGSSTQRAPKAKFGYHEILELDLPVIIKKARKLFPNKKRVFLGHSLGGHLSLLHAATRPDAVNAIAIIASGSVYYKAYRFPQNIKTWLGTRSSVWLSAIMGYFPGHKIGFGGRQPKQVMRDWAYQGRTGNFVINGSDLNYEAALQDLDCPVFAYSIDKDKLAPHSATDHLISKAPIVDLTRMRYRPSEHLASKIDHFRWVKHNKEIIDEISKWVSQLN
jgi:predicted alpha/beta hydrolase